MAYYFKNIPQGRSLIPVLPSDTTTLYVPTTTDIGMLVIQSSNKAKVLGTTVQLNAKVRTADGILGIVSKVDSTGSTHGSTNPFYVRPVETGDVLVADVSTTYENSTAFYLDSTSLGRYFGPCYTTGATGAAGTEALMALYINNIDPSIADTSCESTRGHIFKMIDYSTQDKQVTVVVQSS